MAKTAKQGLGSSPADDDVEFGEIDGGIAVEGDDWYHFVKAAVDYILEGNLTVRYKEVRGRSSFGPLIPHEEQRMILSYVLECAREERPVRGIILKSRQIGMSTIIAALYYVMTSIVKGIHAVIGTSDDKNYNAIWRIYRTFKNKDARKLKTNNDSKTEVIFKDTDSGLFVSIANPNMGKGDNITLLHASEYAIWKEPEDTLDSVFPCVPDHYSTMIFIESTGEPNSDFESFFRRENDQYMLFVKGEKDKKGKPIERPEWMPFFFDWPIHKKYSDEITTDKAFDILKTKDPDEMDLMDAGATASQIAWRRRTIATKFRGDARRFGKAYPANIDEAFQAGSKSFFTRDSLDRLSALVREPEGRWEIALDDDKRSEVMSKNDEGRFRVYRPPILGHRYVIGGDAAGESEDAVDKRSKSQSALVVVDESDGEVVACWSGYMGGHAFGDLMAAVGYYYNTAKLVPENEKHGMIATSRLAHELAYPRLYTQDAHDKLDIKESDRIGWRQSSSNRIMMLDTFQRLAHEGCIDIPDEQLFQQMKSFVEKPSGKVKARLNTKDDLVISAGMAFFVASRRKAWGVKDRSVAMREARREKERKQQTYFDRPVLKPQDFGTLYANPTRRFHA